MTKKWTSEDHRFFTESYKTMSNAEIAEKLGRSKAAIALRAWNFGITKKQKMKWTQEADKQLASLARSTTASKIAEKLGCFTNEVRVRLKQLGLQYEPPNTWTPKDQRIIRELYPTTSAKKIAEILGRTISAVYNYATMAGLRSDIRRWTPEQDAELVRLYSHTPNKILAEKFGRSKDALVTRAQALGLIKAKQEMEWTPEADELLASLASFTAAPAIAEKLGCSAYFVRVRMRQLGLRYQRPDTWTSKDKRIIRKLYPTTSAKKIAEILGRTTDAILCYATKVGLKNHVRLWTPEQESELIRLYPHTPTKVVAEKLGRSFQSVMSRAKKIGLKKNDTIGPQKKAVIAEPCQEKSNISYSRTWKLEDEKIIRKHYPTMPTQEVAKMVGRSVSAVHHRAAYLCVTKCTTWTPEQNAELVRLYPHTSFEIIAEKLGRSLSSIIRQIKKLNLRKNKPWTSKDEKLLLNLYPRKKPEEIAKILGRTRPAVILKAIKLGLQSPRTWTIEADAYLIRNYHRMTCEEIADVYAHAHDLGLKKNKMWTSKDVFLLGKIYPDVSPQDASRILNRSVDSLRSKIKKVQTPNWQTQFEKKGKRWTKEEDDALRQLYHSVPNKGIAEFIGRSEQAVAARARKIRLDRYEKPKENDLLTEYTSRLLFRISGIEPSPHLKYGNKTHRLFTVLKGKKYFSPPKEPSAMAVAFAEARNAALPARPLRVAFAGGAPELAARTLEAILGAGYEVPFVFIRSDGVKHPDNALKQLAQKWGLRTVGHWEAFAESRPDVLVTAAYDLILSPEILALPRLGSLNIHASLLPRWRGAAPVQRAIEAGDTETGITIMQMDAGLDTGPMCLRRTMPIAPDDTAGSLHDKLARLGAKAIVETLARMVSGDLFAGAQPTEGITYARKISRIEAEIDWQRSAVELERQIRAFDPEPGIFGICRGSAVKFWSAQVVMEHGGEPGSILRADASGVMVACGKGALNITELQRPGYRRMEVAEFLRSFPLLPGEWFDFQGSEGDTVPDTKYLTRRAG